MSIRLGDDVVTGKNKLFYGWILAVGCMIMCTATSLCSAGMTTNLAAIRSTFGFTGAQTSMIITIRSVSALVFTLLASKYYDLIGIKKGMILAMISGVIAFVVFAFSGAKLWMYYIGSAITGFTYAYGLMLPCSILLRRWFNHSIGTALAIASCGTGLVSIVFTPIIQVLLNSYGIQVAFFFQAGFILLTAILLAIIVVEYPEEKGLTVLGGENLSAQNSNNQKSTAQNPTTQNPTAQSPTAQKSVSLPTGTSLATKWVTALMIATILVGMSSSPAVSHYTLHYTTAGIDAMDVAKAIAVYGVVIMVSKLCLGGVIDKFGILKATIIYSLICSIGFVAVALIDSIPTIPWMYVGLLVTAAGAVIQTLGYPNWISRLDLSHYTKSVSRCQLGYQIGVLVGSLIPGVIADVTGSYSLAYVLFAIAMFISGAIVLVVFKKNGQ